MIEKIVSLTPEEYDSLRTAEAAEEVRSSQSLWQPLVSWLRAQQPFLLLEETKHLPGTQTSPVTFVGYRRRTKDILLSFMYKEEIACWMQQAAQDELLEHKGSRLLRRGETISEEVVGPN